MENIQSTGVCHEPTFRSLFQQQARHLRNYLIYKGAPLEQAEDLMQEAFLRLWRECARVPAEKAKGFLFTVAGNLFLDTRKRAQVELRFLKKSNPPGESESPQFILETNELHERLQKALAELPDSQRTVFLMNRVDGLTYAEIAGRLELSVKAIEKRMHLALLELRLIMKNI
ncbi:MAG: RNA polymerase sigma factor [Bacteroidota bacterium]